MYLEGVSLFSLFYNQGDTDHLGRSYDIEKERLSLSQQDQNRGLRQEHFEFVKHLLSLRSPCESVGFFRSR